MNANKDVIRIILFYGKTPHHYYSKKMNASATLSASRVVIAPSFTTTTRYVRMIKSVSLPLSMI